MYRYIFYFFFASFGGWIWEVIIMFTSDGHFCNRGFFYGPWLPVYGLGAIFFYALLHRFKERRIFVFILSLVTGTCLELLAGWLLDHFWSKRYWDYSDLPFDLHGYVCLFSALGFGFAGLMWVCWASDYTWRLMLGDLRGRMRNITRCDASSRVDVRKKPARWLQIVLWLLVLAFLLDLCIAIFTPNIGRGINFSN